MVAAGGSLTVVAGRFPWAAEPTVLGSEPPSARPSVHTIALRPQPLQ